MAGSGGSRAGQPDGSAESRRLPGTGVISARLGRVFSPRALVVAIVALGAGFLLGRTLAPFAGGIGGIVGVFAGAFLLGLRGGRRRYLETGVAGALVAGLTAILEFFVLSVLAGIGLPVVAIGTGIGVLAAVLGLYLGRDLHAGLTRSL